MPAASTVAVSMAAVFTAAVFMAAEGIADNPEAKPLARTISI
jgi:hypothetical protein